MDNYLFFHCLVSKNYHPQIDGKFGLIKYLDILLQIWSVKKL